MTGLKRSFTVVSLPRQATLYAAFASDDGLVVNQHFGSATGFVVYGVNDSGHWLVQAAQFDRLAECSAESKLADKLQLLSSCSVLFCRACGSAAQQRLDEKAIRVIRVAERSKILSLLQELTDELKEGEPNWLELCGVKYV
ncbi:NifB/NifX family molybdenum-iron cluster-binding protein [Agaribacterium haliotis]|uniref:NifB/NifX family molybdenum-iron cluster-binding protein n=1 Tax=Agaribacterium haliotis TaxID=2013869 RepID=UPI000BB5581C|nr:NifB/NifX family molybdenum-iron cluster-binding protein [Agaribacterium haliotis]